jgi:hypothetical protein
LLNALSATNTLYTAFRLRDFQAQSALTLPV